MTQHFPPEEGAHATRWAWLSDAIVAQGHTLDVVVPRWRNTRRLASDNPRLSLHEVQAMLPGLGLKRRLANEALTMAQSLNTALRTPKPDLVLTTVPALSALPLGWAVSRLRRVPLVVELRDAWPHLLSEMDTWNDDGTTNTPPPLQRHPLSRKLIARIMWHQEKAAAATIVTAEALGDDLRARGLKNVHLARNIAPRPVAVAPRDTRHQELRVLYLGSFGRAQKLATAVRAASLVQERGVDITLRLVGGGVHELPLRHLVERTNAPVEFVHRVPHDGVSELYDWADTVLVMLRKWYGMEMTVPSKMYEALTAGRHITGSVAGEAAQIIRDSQVGDAVPPEDPEALARLWLELAADKQRLTVGRGGEDWIAQHGQPGLQEEGVLAALEDGLKPRTASPLRRVVGLARNVSLAASATAMHLDQDRANFLVLVARRTNLGKRLPTTSGPRAWQILASHLADRPADMAAAAAAWTPRAGRFLPLTRLAASAAQARGQYHLVPSLLVTREDRARRLLEAGDITKAIGVLPPGSRMAARLRSQRQTMLASYSVPEPSVTRPANWRPEPNSVLHILTNSLPHTRSGYTLRSQAIMTSQRERGWRVAAVTRLGYPVTIGRLTAAPLDVVDSVPIRRLIPPVLPPTVEERLAIQASMISELVPIRRPSILHTTTDYTNALVVEAVAKAWDIPWIYEMRGQLELTWLSKRPPALAEAATTSERLQLLRARETACATAASAVVVLSEVQKADLVSRGVAADKITVVPNAVDQSLMVRQTSTAEARAGLGLEPDASWVGAVSSLVDYEGFDVLLEAVALLRSQGRDVRCALVGDGTSRPGLIARAKELDIADFCVFPGRVGRTEAVSWVEALDMVVVPRRDTPVCRLVTPLKPVEAMALGRPVVGSDLPALRELLEPSGQTLVPPEDPQALATGICETLDDADSLALRVSRGRAWAGARTWQAAAERYDQLYKSLGGHT